MKEAGKKKALVIPEWARTSAVMGMIAGFMTPFSDYFTVWHGLFFSVWSVGFFGLLGAFVEKLKESYKGAAQESNRPPLQ